MKRFAYFISDGTGITAETLGNALLAQFDKLQFTRVTLPYIDSTEKANNAVAKINQAAKDSGAPAILFDTIVDKNIRSIIDTADAFKVDIFEAFLHPLEQLYERRYSVPQRWHSDHPEAVSRWGYIRWHEDLSGRQS